MDAELRIVIPCFNEARRFDGARYVAAIETLENVSFIFVDDGSTDETPIILEELCRRFAGRCSLLTLEANSGKPEAVRRGMNAAASAGSVWIGYWDADLATPLETVPLLLEQAWRDARTEVVLGSRVKMLGSRIDRSPLRHFVGRVFATLASFTLRLPVYDTQCGAKLFRDTPALRHALAAPFASGWAFDVELLQRLQRIWRDTGEQRMVEVPLRLWVDVGESKVSLRGGLKAFLSLGRLWAASVIGRSDDQVRAEVRRRVAAGGRQ